jgi:hypothetical protein
MMALSLFEKYETQRKKYRPGARWRDRTGMCIVQELEIFKVEKTRYDDNVHFLITKSTDYPRDWYGVGQERSWTKSYMEDYYEPILT